MLKHFNLNKQYVRNIYDYTDDSIVSELSTGDKTLTFTLRGKSDIQCEEYIQTEDQRYVVKEIQPGNDDTVEYTCQLDLEPLEGSVFEVFTAADKTVTQAANLALAGTGWRVSTSLTKKRNVQCMKKTPLEVLYLIRDAFMCEIRFDSINKIVYYAEQFGSDRGVYFRKDLNLKDVSVRTDSYDYCTRIIPIGKDDLRIDNNGKEYVENYQYSSKIRAIIWEDSSYEDADALQEDAEGKLEDLSKPKKSYSADIRDLAKLSADYDILSFGLGDTVWIVDEGKGVKEKQRIVKITEYPHDPGKNKCELSNTVLSWEEMQKKLEAAANAWEDVSNKDGSINGVHVYGISDGNKVIIQTEVTNNPTVQANAAGVAANTTAINGVVQDLTAVTARVGTIEASYLTATQIQANYAAINFANIDTANIDTAKVMNLFTQVGLIRDAVISQAKITGYLDAVKINAASIDAGTLSVDRLVIRGDNTSLVYAINNITGALQAQNVNTINGEVLTDRTILADKIVAHTITANEITAENIVGTGGWINLAAGTFNYGAGALVWNGSTLTVNGDVTAASGNIGGWTISTDQIYKAVVTGGYEYRAIMNAPSSISAATKAITIAVRTNNGSGTTGAWSYPFGVAYDGSLTATKGTLGGWSIGTNNISTTNTSGNYVTLSNGTNTNQDILVVRTGAGTTASPYVWPFYLRADGTIVATKATITGSVTATNGKIAGFTIDGNSLKNGDYIDLSAYNSTYGGARLQLGPGSGAHATLSSSQLVIYNANGVDSYITPTAIYTGGTITSYGAITAGSTIVANYNGAMIRATNPTNGGVFCGVHASESGYAGVYTNGYWNGSALSGAGRWLIYRSTADTTCVPSELYTYNEGYTSLRPVIGTNTGGAAIGVMQSSASAIGIYARWGGSATADMTGRTISCPASDVRLKNNIKDSTINALSVIDAIRIRQFDWKDKSRGHWDCGMVVDEMEKDVDPRMCIGGGEDEDGNISCKSVDTFYLQGYEVKAIQELHAEIRALKGQLKGLKSKIA